MSQRLTSVFLLTAFLAGCGGNPFSAGDLGGEVPEEEGGSVPGIPTEPTPAPAGSLLSATVSGAVDVDATVPALRTYASGAPQLQIKINAQDLSGAYNRDAAFDVGGYEGYSYQGTTSNRKVVALVKKSGTTTAMVGMEAGQFNESHKGGAVYRTDVFTLPTEAEFLAQRETGRFNYSGTYAGLLNIGSATPGGPGGGLNPSAAYRTTGRALVTADFDEMRVSGGVDNRSIVDTGLILPNIQMSGTDILANGSFAGGLTRTGPTSYEPAGSYSGIFGGIDANEVAVLMVFNPITGETELFEQGMVVVENCVAVGGPACP